MNINDYILMIIGIMISIIGFFLKNTINELKRIINVTNETKSRLDLIEREYGIKYIHTTEKFDELNNTVKDLIKEIKILNKELHKKKD
jgi:hypothetical protein